MNPAIALPAPDPRPAAPPSRRELLTGFAGALALAPAARAARPRAAHRRLVLLQLSGGQDGLSLLVPFTHKTYREARSLTRLDADDVLEIAPGKGLNGRLANLGRRWREGQLALVEGVGYPGMDRSHFASMDVWHAADPGGRQTSRAGWIGRLAEHAWGGEDTAELVVHFGEEAPYSLFSSERPPVTLVSPTGYRWFGPAPETGEAGETAGAAKRMREETPDRHAGRDAALARLRRSFRAAQDSSRDIRAAAFAHEPQVEYPREPLGAALRDVAGLIRGGLRTRVFSVALSGFDTHAEQRRTHDGLLRTLDGCLDAFLRDLETSDAGRETLVLAFSEFGRRVAENASGGTDHGKGGLLFVLGAGAQGGLHGAPPALGELDHGDLAPTTDFRSAYASLIADWFDADPVPVLGARFEGLSLCLA